MKHSDWKKFYTHFIFLKTMKQVEYNVYRDISGGRKADT